MPKIAEVKLSSWGLWKKIEVAELRSCGCGATFLKKLRNCDCGSASFKLRNCGCGIAVADSKKSCACPPLLDTLHVHVESPSFMSILHFHGAYPHCMSIHHVHAASLCFMSLLHVRSACQCCSPCCIMHIHTTCRCMSMPNVCAAWPCSMSLKGVCSTYLRLDTSTKCLKLFYTSPQPILG